MKKNIHPAWKMVKTICSCGHTFETGSTIKGDEIRVETCSKCHPFYTGKKTLLKTSTMLVRKRQKNSANNKNPLI
jgi:large subunit ribosomal protein L31